MSRWVEIPMGLGGAIVGIALGLISSVVVPLWLIFTALEVVLVVLR